ncbi:hypothetical protein [Saccharomonospora viridis]|nr:hypothetical protein [Saccharomonospora viridis]
MQPYLYARDAAGDSGIIQRAISLFSSGMESRRIFDEKRQELNSYNIEYREGIPPSEFDYLGIAHEKLKSDVEYISPEGITVYSDGYHKLYKLFSDLSEELKAAVNKSKQGWEGEAAESAHGYFTSLATWSEGNSVNADMASQIIAAEADAASAEKSSMPEPIPFDLEMVSWMPMKRWCR